MRENVCCGVLVNTADEGGIGLDTVVEAVNVEEINRPVCIVVVEFGHLASARSEQGFLSLY